MSTFTEYSVIGDFYDKKSVLITGATGLVGKVLAYKILRSLPTVNHIFLIIRDKRGKRFDERFREMLEKSCGLFDDINEKLLKKLVPIKGDITRDGLGLSLIDRTLIVDSVSVVFHCAADVTFDADLKSQLSTNVGGTKHIIDLCRALKKFQVLTYVSTVYANPLQLIVGENIYQTHVKPNDLLSILKYSRLDLNDSTLLGHYPNTYSLTKNLAENLIDDEFKGESFTTAIVRPGIISASYKEPICGWYNSITSLAGVLILIGVGLARVLRRKLAITVDAIPVDMVANTCIAAAWASAAKYESRIRVYNCNSSCLGALTHAEIQQYLYEMTRKYPLSGTIRPPIKVISEHYLWPIRWVQFFSETCFAYLCDLLLMLLGKKRFVVKKMSLYHKLDRLCQCFVGRQWYFTNANMIELANELSGSDKTTFNCDIQGIDWNQYNKLSYFTTRKLLLHESDEDIQRAQTRLI